MKFSYSANYFPPAPGVEIQLGVPGESLAIGPLWALMDTGADISIIPFQYIEPLDLQVDNRKYLRSQWGEGRKVDIYLLDLEISGLRFGAIEVVADEHGNEIILGRNLLNKLSITLNGPRQEIEIEG